LNDFLSAQLFHNPMLVTLLEKIIVGGRINHDDYEIMGFNGTPAAAAGSSPKAKTVGAEKPKPKNKAEEDNTMIELVSPFDLQLQTTMMGSKRNNSHGEGSMLYKDVFFCFNKLKAIPIAILRGPSLPDDIDDFGNKLSYVYTNPPPETVVRKQDKIFLLVSTKVLFALVEVVRPYHG